jgi:hypothetical protein
MLGRPVVFVRLGASHVLLALLCARFGFDVRYLTVVPYLRRGGVCALLAKLRVLPVDFETLSRVDAALSDSDPRALVESVAERLMPDELGQALAPLFPGLSDAPKKLRVCLHDYIEERYFDLARVLLWLEAAHPTSTHALVWAGPVFLARAMIRPRNGMRITFLSLPGKFGVSQVRSVLASIRAYVASLFSRRGAQQTEAKPLPNDAVLFFPHDGVSYGRLFEKNYFYSENPQSPLHPDRIRHLAVNTGEGVVLRPNGGWVRYLAVFRFARWALWNLSLVARMPFPVASCILALRTQVHVAGWRTALSSYEKSPLAIVGYEILFSKPLAIALEQMKIPTVATQERYIAAFYRNCSFVLNTYLCASSFIAERLRNADRVIVDKYIPVGMVRTDLLHRTYGKARVPLSVSGGTRRLVVALNYHSERDSWSNSTMPITNWEANRLFLRDMISLARDLPEIYVIIRGKNADWMSLPAFAGIVETISRMDNIHVDHTYDRYNVSYELCANADLVIAKHTSLGDECLSVGIPVLFHDYTHNSPCVVASAFDYGAADVMCFDYPALLRRTKVALAGRASRLNSDRPLESLYGDLNDGAVAARIRSIVAERFLAGAPA